MAGLTVMFTGFIAMHQRNADGEVVDDWDLAANLLLSFVLSYTMIFTVMEPLRAAIKALYVAFAQHPRSLSQAFPLIYHRLTRLSESNVS